MSDAHDPFAAAMRMQELGRATEAEQLYRVALQENPRRAAAHNNLATLLQEKGDLAAARSHYERAIKLQPDFAPSHNNLGNLLLNQGDATGALASYRKALRLKPDFVEALNNCGKLLQDQRQWDLALNYYERALRLNPAFAVAWFNRATLHLARGLVPQAIADYREAWRLNPADPSPAINLAILFNDLGQPDDALECCQKIVDRGGDSAMIRHLAAAALRALGRVDESIAAYRASLALVPDPAQHSNLLYELNFQTNSDPAAVFAEHLAWAAQYAEPLTAASPPHANDRTPNRKLRIGYFSPHFRDHAVTYFTEPLLAAHDRQRFEVVCYSNWPIGDAVTARLQASADYWRNVDGASDEDVANQIRADRIDILVDLTGHIGENRLLLFRAKPAPIQVTYLGYQNTTGMSAMDYRLTDEWADPPDQTDRFYTERLVRLPRSFFCYRPDDESPPVSLLPALATGQVTFGSFNLFAKVNSHVIESWLDILSRVPGSRLLILANRGGYAERELHSRAQARGIDPGRIEICARRRAPSTCNWCGKPTSRSIRFPSMATRPLATPSGWGCRS